MKKITRYSVNRYILQKILSTPNKKINSGTKLVLLNLISRLGGKNSCWPSQATIAKDLGLSVRQVRNHIHKLKSLKLIKIKRGGINIKGKSFETNEYCLDPILHQR